MMAHVYFGCLEPMQANRTQTFSQCPCATNFVLTTTMFVVVPPRHCKTMGEPKNGTHLAGIASGNTNDIRGCSSIKLHVSPA